MRNIRRHFLHPNEQILNARDQVAADKLRNAQTLEEFTQAAAVFSHHERDHSYEDWLECTCPMRVVHAIDIPMLCINAWDDPICLKEKVVENGLRLVFENPNCAVVTTNNGSHCAHQYFDNTSWFPLNWGHTVAIEFIEGVVSNSHI